MKWDDPSFWLDLIQLLGVSVVGIYSWHIQKHRATNVRMDKEKEELIRRIDKVYSDLSSRVMMNNEQIIALQVKADKAVSHNDIGLIYEQLRQTNQTLNHLAGGFRAMSRNFEIIQEALLRERQL